MARRVQGGGARARMAGCQQHRGQLRLPAGTRLSKQNVTIPPAAGGGRGHVYHHAGAGQWFTAKAVAQGVWLVCTYIGGTCPCGG